MQLRILNLTLMKKISLRMVIFGAVMFTLGLLTYYLYDDARHPDRGLIRVGQVREGHGTYTNPLLECDIASDTISAPKVRFEHDFRANVEQVRKQYGVTEVAAYYRDLNNGPAFGVNQTKQFFPASLLKVPLMMAFYKALEQNPTLLDKKIVYHASATPELANQIIKPAETLEEGKEYTVRDLIERMIIYSDNEAMELLYPLLPEEEYQTLYHNLGIDDIDTNNPLTDISVVEYSTFFRVLFNASYLTQKSSEEALSILARSTFTQGIRAGVPDAVAVAHKFGERDLGDGYYQLHDCGIIYAPKSPYLLCVMTRGTSQEALEKAVKDISAYTYERVIQQQ